VKSGIANEAITWSDWSWSTNYSEDVDRGGFEDMGDLTFDPVEYDQALRLAICRLMDA
jgi:hypothetical protein